MGVDLATNNMRKLVYKWTIATNEAVIIGINSGTFRDRQCLPTGTVGGSRPWESRVFPGSSTSEVVGLSIADLWPVPTFKPEPRLRLTPYTRQRGSDIAKTGNIKQGSSLHVSLRIVSIAGHQ